MYDNNGLYPPGPIGDQIRRLRNKRGLTLAAAADRAGTSAPSLHRYENGWDRFEVRTLRKIAEALGARLEVRLVPVSEATPPEARDPSDLLTLLAPLFWDHDLGTRDLEKHRSWVIGRVLMFGDSTQVRATRRTYGDVALREAIQRREIDPRTRNYWNLILEDRCIPKS